MCNLYTNKSTVAEVADLFRTPATYGSNAPEEVYPGYPGMIVREQEGARVLQSMTWGFPVRLNGMKPTSKPKPVNNARDDKLLTPFWKHWFTTPAHRCLIPFTAFAEAEGLPLDKVIEVVASGAAGNWFLERRGPAMVRGEFPPGFRLALHHKDLAICRAIAERHGVSLPVVEMTLIHYRRLMEAGFGDEDISALFREKRRLFGMEEN